MATPPNEEDADRMSLKSDTQSFKAGDLYSNYDLHLNDLQVVCGKLLSENLTFYIGKGHSTFHLFEKFDINVKIDLCKLSGPTDEEKENDGNVTDELWPSIKVSIRVGLLKLNVDDLKATNFHRMINNLTTISTSAKSRSSHSRRSILRSISVGPRDCVQAFLAVDLKLDEINVAMSIAHIDLFDDLDEIRGKGRMYISGL